MVWDWNIERDGWSGWIFIMTKFIQMLKYVEICWNMLKYVEICGNMWKYVSICVSICFSMTKWKMTTFRCLPVGIHLLKRCNFGDLLGILHHRQHVIQIDPATLAGPDLVQQLLDLLETSLPRKDPQDGEVHGKVEKVRSSSINIVEIVHTCSYFLSTSNSC